MIFQQVTVSLKVTDSPVVISRALLLYFTYGFKKSLSITIITKGSQGCKTELSSVYVLYIVVYAPGIYKLKAVAVAFWNT